jgi:hypothetical protein
MTNDKVLSTPSEKAQSEEAQATHRRFAVDCFNGTWDFLDKADRTKQENFDMIHMAHASRFHWGQIGTPLEFARGDWQLSRVYADLGMGKAARVYAQNCLEHCLENGIGDFDLAFAYEALARAYAVTGDQEKLHQSLDLATQAGDKIADEGDRTYFFDQLKTLSKS